MNCERFSALADDMSAVVAHHRVSVAFVGATILSALLSACGTPEVVAPLGRASMEDSVAASSRGLHRVIDGESLYSIAWRYGLDYRDLSHWNAIAEPFTIYRDQLLRVSRPAVIPPMPASSSTDTRALARQPSTSRKKRATASVLPKTTTSPEAKRAVRSAAPAHNSQAVRNWRWPVKGRVIGAFGKAGGKGIDIAGDRGSAIKAAAPGDVVYSGSGLRGYGQLIIVKHNKRYLSAYAHNDRLHVKEGDTVKGGQRIAEMGDSDAKSVRLHFEIRRDGKPVDPTRFLPR